MATTKTSGTRTTKASASGTKTVSKTVTKAEPVVTIQAEPTQEDEIFVTGMTVDEPVKEEPKKIVPSDIDLRQIVTVRNGFQGSLTYISKSTGERFHWDAFGDEQDMELGELRRARSSSKKFFINNWFMFDEPWIVDFLGMRQYYKYAVKIEDFDNLFTMPPTELEDALSHMSDGQKRSVAYRARQLIAEGGIDSNRVIALLEKYLDTQLIERD